ncbi:MAG: hypothetical protein ABFC77_15580 [Thermoguttaceae bacterium]
MSIESILERIAISAERTELLLGKILDKIDDLPDLSNAQQLLEEIRDGLSTVTAAAEPFGTASREVPAAPIPPLDLPAPEPAPAPAAAAFVPPPAPPAPAATVPFTDQAGLIKYGMEKYRTLGAAKGGLIQNVIVDMGFNNLSKIPSERWAEFVSRCEAL